MNQPTEEQLYEIKANILARKLSEAINEITELYWQLDQQTREISALKGTDVSENQEAS